MATAATPAKLSDGSWGARVSGTPGAVCVGSTIEICTRGGKRWIASVHEVVSRSNGVCIVRTSAAGSRARRAPAKQRAARVATCGYPCPVSGRRCVAADQCHDCQP